MADDLERIQQELAEAKERYRRLVEGFPLTLYTLDILGKARELYISPRVEPTLGIPQQQFIEDPDFWLENIHEDDRPRVAATIRAAHGEPRVELEYRARRADGTYMWVRNLGTRHFDDEGRTVLIVGVVVDIDELKRAHQQSEQRADELAALNRVASALTNVTDLSASLHMAARELTQVFNTRGSTVTLIDEAREHAEVVAEYFTDPSLPSVLGLKVPLDVPAWKRLDEERTAIVIERPQEDMILGPVRDVMRERCVAQLLVAPLLSRGELIGNMSVSHEPGRSFAPSEVMLAQTLASPVAQAVENARLYKAAERASENRNLELAAKNALLIKISQELEGANQELARLSVTDSLTGISNRRQFHEVIETEWRRALRGAESLAVMMIDVDFFKLYNDEYGHQRGDQCLTSVARALQSGLHRGGDFVARYGGEEFVVILPNTDEAAGRAQAERLCERVRELAIPHEQSSAAPVVTVSIGCAATYPTSTKMPATLIAAADQALYEAKRRGRNQVCGRDD